MVVKFDSRDWMSALEQAAPAPGPAAASASPTPAAADAEWQKHEKLKIKVIEARVKLKLMRDRTDALKQALARYREQEEARRA